MSTTLLEFRGVHFAYDPSRPVLSGVDLSIGAGDRLGLVGANGGGKTTLLHLIVGLVKPTKGEIVCAGIPRRVEADFLDVRRRVGLLFQDSDDQLFCPTVAEDIAFGPLNLGMSRKETETRVKKTLAAVGLPDYEDRITYKLSGGEKRLVALATVLAMEPELLLLDEPLTGLDEEHAERVTNVLLSIPHAMLIVAHDRDFLAHTTTRQLRLSNGKLT